jgi:hypothetical protein
LVGGLGGQRRKRSTLLINRCLMVVMWVRKTWVARVRWKLLRNTMGIRSGVMTVRRSSDGRRRPSITRLAIWSVWLLTMLGNHVGRLLHWRPC